MKSVSTMELRSWGKPVLFLSIGLIVGLLTFGVQRCTNDQWKNRREAENLRVETQRLERLEAERQERIKAASSRIKLVVGKSQAILAETITHGRERADHILEMQMGRRSALVSKADEKIQGYGNALELVRRIAKDKVFGSHDTEDYLNKAFQPISDDQAETATELQRACEECLHSVKLQISELHTGVTQVLDETGFQVSDLDVSLAAKRLSNATADKVESAIRPASEPLKAAIDGLIAREISIQIYRLVTRLLEKEAAEEAGSLGVGAGGAAIPFVDIITTTIAVGGTLWTAYDIHKAVGDLKQIDPVLYKGLSDSNSDLKKTSDEFFTDLEIKIDALFK